MFSQNVLRTPVDSHTLLKDIELFEYIGRQVLQESMSIALFPPNSGRKHEK